jgi:hypothetical protein
MALVTLLCLDQVNMVPTPIEKPRPVSDVISDVIPRGHAPWLHRLLLKSAKDTMDGARPLPWLTTSLAREDKTIA